MNRTLRLAQPPGCRSTSRSGSAGSGGSWLDCNDQHGGGIVKVQLAHLLERLASSDRDLLRVEIGRGLRRARLGELTYGKTRKEGEVCEADCVETVLELRLDDRNMSDEDGSEQERCIRLYYSEPEHLDDVLLLVSLRHKAPGVMGLEEQTRHMKEADFMIHRHFSLEDVL